MWQLKLCHTRLFSDIRIIWLQRNSIILKLLRRKGKTLTSGAMNSGVPQLLIATSFSPWVSDQSDIFNVLIKITWVSFARPKSIIFTCKLDSALNKLVWSGLGQLIIRCCTGWRKQCCSVWCRGGWCRCHAWTQSQRQPVSKRGGDWLIKTDWLPKLWL